jgi:putative peptide zinc metalloprotease protein
VSLAQRESPLDAAVAYPQLAADVEVRRFGSRWDGEYAIGLNPRDFLHLRLSAAQARVIGFLDGQTPLPVAAALAGVELPAAVNLVAELAADGFLAGTEYGGAASPRRHPVVVLSVADLDLQIRDVDVLARWVHRTLRPLLTRTGGVIALLMAVTGLVALAGLLTRGWPSAPGDHGWALPLWVALSALVTFGHELGHATALVHYGRRVPTGGVRLYFGAPAFYIDASDVLLLGARQRIVEAAAGVAVELVLAAPAALYAWLHPGGAVAAVLGAWAVLNYAGAALNLLPFLGFDGQHILCDLLGIPDLRDRARAALCRRLSTADRRSRWTRREAWLCAYRLAELGVAVGCVGAAIVFWHRVLGGLVLRTWDSGPAGAAVVAAFAATAALQFCRSVAARLRAP